MYALKLSGKSTKNNILFIEEVSFIKNLKARIILYPIQFSIYLKNIFFLFRINAKEDKDYQK
jgi:hypothetical protein